MWQLAVQQPALHNLHLFTVHICRRTKLKRSWRAPWRPPLASRRRCLRGWRQIHSPVWKGWPGISWSNSICAYSLTRNASNGFLNFLSGPGLPTLPCPPPVWATSRMALLNTLLPTPTDITLPSMGFCWDTGQKMMPWIVCLWKCKCQ